MEQPQLNWIANFIWGIADDVLRDLYVRGKYRDVILPMTVLRRLDAVLEPTKQDVLDMKASLDAAGIVHQDPALRQAAGRAFYNTSKFTLNDLRNRANQQQLRADLEDYLDGYSPNVQDILDNFEFRNQIPRLSKADALGTLIEKFLSPDINLSPYPVNNGDGSVKHPGLDNHGMGTIFEELVRRFNEENNEEAGEHWTPRDAVKLMAKLIFLPVADRIESGTYLLYDGACDWMTGTVPQYGDLDDHHIVPKDWGKDQAGVGGLIDTILNRTPMTADTNRKAIRNRLPSEYLPELIQSNGEKTVRATLESHFISAAALDILLRNPFTAADFEEFISERQRTIKDAIEDLLVKERLDLPPQLRELDAEIEEIELRIRSIIVDALAGDPLRLPPHVQQNAEERIERAARKNPAMELERYKTLEAKLEYCDLLELQDTISSKDLWPLFQLKFGRREGLAARFNQLAGLRNCIRHSRNVDEITRKDGEAALLWFRQAVAR